MNMGSYNCCSTSTFEGKQVDTLASILKIVAEPSRLKLLCILSKGEHCVCQIEEHVEFSQSLISHHLKDLKESGMVQDEKRGLYVYYSLTENGRSITGKLFGIMSREDNK
jgi:DNA-binding transcriptional ArsR family regulator